MAANLFNHYIWMVDNILCGPVSGALRSKKSTAAGCGRSTTRRAKTMSRRPKYFADAFGIIVNEESFDVEHVEVTVFGNQREYLRSLPLHSSQQKKRRRRIIRYFRSACARYSTPNRNCVVTGRPSRCLSPQWLRDVFAAEVMAKLY